MPVGQINNAGKRELEKNFDSQQCKQASCVASKCSLTAVGTPYESDQVARVIGMRIASQYVNPSHDATS